MQCFVARSYPRPLFLGLVKEAIVHAVELQHGADLRLFQLVARKQPTLSAVWVGIVILLCTKSA